MKHHSAFLQPSQTSPCPASADWCVGLRLLLPVELQAQARVPVVRPGDEVRLVVVQALLQLVVQQLLHVVCPELAELLQIRK